MLFLNGYYKTSWNNQKISIYKKHQSKYKGAIQPCYYIEFQDGDKALITRKRVLQLMIDGIIKKIPKNDFDFLELVNERFKDRVLDCSNQPVF